ncbi:MAG TPA: hypothetical protein EYP14_10440 [Planctomycetaceae bacterium]|nr:hypothetical protein [Planctomycetaceae bacterium]
MSIFGVLEQRSHASIRTVVTAIEQFITTKQLPSLPKPKNHFTRLKCSNEQKNMVWSLGGQHSDMLAQAAFFRTLPPR